MAPLGDTMDTDQRLRAAFQRSRSLTSLGNGMGFDDMNDEQSVDPFSDDFMELQKASPRQDPLWFPDNERDSKTQRQAKFVASHAPVVVQDPNSKVAFDCFGFSLFDLDAGSPFPAPVDVKKEPVQTPEEAGKAARRARRRRHTLVKSDPGIPRHPSTSHTPTRRRDISSPDEPMASSLPKEFLGNKMRRCKSVEGGGMEQLMEESRSGGRMRRTRSNEDGGMEKSQSGEKMRRTRSRSRENGGMDQLMQESQSGSNQMRRSKSSSGISASLHNQGQKVFVGKSRRRSGSRRSGDAGLGMMMLLDQSSGSLGSQDSSPTTILELEIQQEDMVPRPRRRSGSTRRSLSKQLTHPNKIGGNKISTLRNSLQTGSSTDLQALQHEPAPTGMRERRRSRRSEISDSSCPSTNKRLSRSGRSLTSLTSMLLEDNTSSRLVSTSNFHF